MNSINDKLLLIVDDNDRYAENLRKFFTEKDFKVLRARNALEGIRIFDEQKDFLHSCITDITMEMQLSGFWFLSHLVRSKFTGTTVVASTGFDQPLVIPLSKRYLQRKYNVSYLIPKVPLKEGKVVFVPTRKEFSELAIF